MHSWAKRAGLSWDKIQDGLIYLAGLTVLFFAWGGYWSSHWYSKYAMLMAVFSVGYSVYFARMTSWKLFPILLICLLSGVWVAAWIFNSYSQMDTPAFREGMRKDGFYGILCVLAGSWLIIAYEQKHIAATQRLIAFICWASCFYTLLQIGLPVNERGAFSGNPSMNGSLIAMTLPFAIHVGPCVLSLLIVPLSFLAILLTGASIPIGAFTVAIGSYLIASSRKRWAAIQVVACITGSILVAAYMKLGSDLWYSSGRYQMWAFFIAWWNGKEMWMTGTGLGTSFSLLSWLQIHYSKNHNIFMWMHNDWLQILFELGVFGLLSAVVAFKHIADKAMDRPHVVAAWFTLGAVALVNYPLRLPIHAAVATLIAAISLKGGRR